MKSDVRLVLFQQYGKLKGKVTCTLSLTSSGGVGYVNMNFVYSAFV